ncbi:citrate/2-methylcitrate synthase [Oryzihumus leptocrescens]|uniref:Citrate synthase n=1 Tax=Oryzihumus leptocrescens TaxID=297536 RepID=A0A542ZEW8_9MICO|nr:citrate/2-methylcitrate synthase [Oryzihumus leptocrescens]TQL58893.1 citrate synthase [Oryzihumus leptocrescens]
MTALQDELVEVPRGLKGVVVTDTALGTVRGRQGFYHYRQYSAVELAERRSLEDVWHLQLEGRLPDAHERARFAAEVAAARHLPQDLWDALPLVAASGDPMTGLRTAVSWLGAARGMRPVYDLTPAERRADAVALAAPVPTILAALHRLAAGLDPVPPRDDLGHAANYLWMITGQQPEPAAARAVEQYLVLTVDHGFNASTFTARVIASTGADVAACVVGALGALSGPLHGGAPSRALDTLDAIGSADRIDPWVRAAVESGDRIMGFGHPIYRTEDPRSRMLKGVARGLATGRPEAERLVAFAEEVEHGVLSVLAELKPGRELHTNVEFYAGVVMELCGLPRAMFTPTFAVARVIGWSANVLEQALDSKIIRPSSRYVGPPPPQPVPSA